MMTETTATVQEEHKLPPVDTKPWAKLSEDERNSIKAYVMYQKPMMIRGADQAWVKNCWWRKRAGIWESFNPALTMEYLKRT